MLSWRRLALVLWLLGLAPLVGVRVRADAPELAADEDVVDAVEPTAAPVADSVAMLAIRARLERLRDAVKREGSVRTAVEQADLALARARIARAEANEARALRAEQLAEAATSLAERRLARVREVEATTLTLARRNEAQAMAKAARESLAVAQKRAAEAP